jgi:hypothetical protein
MISAIRALSLPIQSKSIAVFAHPSQIVLSDLLE